LLQLLRRLGQGIKAPWVEAAGHNIIPGSLGSALDQNGRLDLHKAALGEELADKAHHVVPQEDVALHALATQVQVAVAKAQRLVDLSVIVDVEHRRLGLAKHLDGVGQDFDLACGHLGVFQARRPLPHAAVHADDELVA